MSCDEMAIHNNDVVTNGEATCEDTIEHTPSSKTIVVQLHICYDSKDKDITNDIVKSITLTPDINCKKFKKLLMSTFNLKDTSLVLKLRNMRGSVIPMSYTIHENLNVRPYTLEVCERYQNVKPFERTVSLPTYEEVLTRKLQSIDNRLVKLENHVPQLPARQQQKIIEEIEDLNDRMNVLDRKLCEADGTQWQGMFKRNPLW